MTLGRTSSSARTIGLLMLVMLSLAASQAGATSGVRSTWTSVYPSSTLATTYSCSLCHTSAPSFNPYGSAMFAAGATTTGIRSIEPQDSDGDGFTNLQEITANTHPGDRTLHPPAGDTTPPSAPGGLTATATSSTQISLRWTAATDNVGVTGYRVYRGATQVGSPTATSYTDSGLSPSTAYSYTVRAVDAAGNVSAASNSASATTPAAPDTTPPSAPSGLSATATSSTQISLTWSASTDNVGVTGYRVYRGATLVGSPTATAYTDSGLSPVTAYSYTVKAVDAAGNLSAASNTASATTPAPPDTTPPSAPAALSATATSSTQISLTWTAATDNVGVTGYRVYRGAALVGSPTATSYTDSGLTPSTAYSYTVKAADVAGNLSAASNTASATTPAAPDATAPSAPTGLGATATSSTQISLTWSAATDNVGVTGYRVYRGATLVGSPTATTYTDSGLSPATAYSYTVKAADAAGNLSAASNTASATTPAAADTTPPSAPSGLSATAASSTQISLSWSASTDNVGVAGYRVYRGAAQVGAPTGTTYTDSGLSPATAYSYTVKAADAAGNLSAASNTASATTPAASDTTAPSAPSGLTATAMSATQVNLSWTAATDNVGVTGYRVYRGATLVGSPTGTTYTDGGLTPGTAYSYTVKAADAAGNLSAASNTASVTPPAVADTTAPSAPAGLTATAASSTQISLSWSAATDDVGVTGYRVFRGATLVGSPTATSYTDSGLSPATAYSYTVKAADAAGNLSAASNTASATTLANTASGAWQAVVVDTDMPRRMAPRSTAEVSITVRNAGTEPWVAGGAFALGAQNPPLNMRWAENRVELGASVMPGAEVTFTFEITAPRRPGAYRCDWQMLQGGAEPVLEAETHSQQAAEYDGGEEGSEADAGHASGAAWFGQVAHARIVVTSFADVWPDHWAWRETEAAHAAGIVVGYPGDLYRPDLPVTRGQMVVYLARALAGGDAAVPEASGSPTFSDVLGASWAFRYVQYAVDQKLVEGYPDGTYRPDAGLNRGEMAVLLARALCGGDALVPAGPATPTFSDVPADSPFFRYVEYLADPARAVVTGYGDQRFHPESTLTRAQMAVFVARAFGLAQ